MFFGALCFVVVWCLIASLVRHYPETMAGYNTMPTTVLYSLMLCWIPCSMLIVAGIYINVRKDKFKR